jgi:hypothetical protein
MVAFRGLLGVAAAAIALGGATIAACGDSGTPISAAGTDGATTETGSNEGGGTGTPDDGGLDGDTITDGGDNINLDAGEDDAGDAGPCNTLTSDAPPVDSTCVSFERIFGGGALVAGTYHLTSVQLLAAPSFCQSQFRRVAFRETMVLTVSNGVATAEVIEQIGTRLARTSTSTFTEQANKTSPLTNTPTCPVARAAAKVAYEAVTVNGKDVLVLRLPYGTALADYRFDRQ